MSLVSIMAMAFGPSNSVSDPNFWNFNRGLATHAGTTVNEFNSYELPVVYSAISIIADAIAQLPIDVGRRDGDNRNTIENHSLIDVLNVRANPRMSAFTQRNVGQSHALGWGNSYAEVQRDGTGQIVGLWPLLPDRTHPIVVNGEIWFATTIGGQTIRLPSDKVLHIPALGFDGLQGWSPLAMARQAIGLGKSLEEHGGKFFANEARSGGFWVHPGRLSDTAIKNLEESIEQRGGLTNAQRVKILEEGLVYQATTIAPEEAQFLQTRQFQIEEIARMYRVPLFMLQSHSKDTAWGTGIAEMSLGFLVFTLTPWIVRTEQEMTHKLLTPAERASGFYIKHTVASLLRGDPAARAEFYSKAIAAGWMTVDEVRALEDMNPMQPGIIVPRPRPTIPPPLSDDAGAVA